MPTTIPVDLFNSEPVLTVLKGAILLILIFYAIFAAVILRQVDLMCKTLISTISPILKAVAMIHAGVAIGLIFFAWGIL